METGGDDPEWPIWYAHFLHDKPGPYLAAPLTRSRLVFCLVETGNEHRAAHADETGTRTPFRTSTISITYKSNRAFFSRAR